MPATKTTKPTETKEVSKTTRKPKAEATVAKATSAPETKPVTATLAPETKPVTATLAPETTPAPEKAPVTAQEGGASTTSLTGGAKPKRAPAKKTTATKTTTKAKATKTTKAKGKTVTKVKKVPVKKATGGADEAPDQRYFKIKSEDGTTHGRFSGKKPKQAANKALTSILKDKKKNKETIRGEVKFTITECTRGSTQKEYNYVGKRQKLEKPMEVAIGDKKIVYQFQNNVKKAKVAVAKTKKVTAKPASE